MNSGKNLNEITESHPYEVLIIIYKWPKTQIKYILVNPQILSSLNSLSTDALLARMLIYYVGTRVKGP